MRQITVYKQTIIDYVDDTRERVAYTLEPQERTSVARHACGGILVSRSETGVAGHLQAPDEAELAASTTGELRLYVGEQSWDAREITQGLVAMTLGRQYAYRSV